MSVVREGGSVWQNESGRRRHPRLSARPRHRSPVVSGAYSAYVPPVTVEHALDHPPGNLRAEIAVVRAMLADLLKMDLAPDQRARISGTLLAALVRLVRENRLVDGSQSDQIDQTMLELLQREGVGMAARAPVPQEGEGHGSTDH